MKYHRSEAEVKERAARIRLLILDVDGVLTDGGLILHADGQESKVFHVHDGHGIPPYSPAGSDHNQYW